MPYDIIYIWNQKYTKINLFTNSNRLTDPENTLVTRRRRGGEGMDWEFGISR